MKRFEGMSAAMATPMKPDESLDFEATRVLVKHLIDKGLDGVLVGGSTGEYNLMSMEERKELIVHSVEAAKGTDGYVIAGASCHRTQDTIELAKFAGEAGADFVLVLPPYYLPTTTQGVYDYFKAVSESTKAGLIIYHYPAAVNVLLEPEFLVKLGRLDNIVGIKNTADMEHTAKLIALNEHYEGFKIVNGYENLFFPTIACGGDGAMGIIQNLIPAQMAEMYRLTKENDFAAAAKINEKMIPLYNIMETDDEPCPGPVKYGLELQGLKAGNPRKPVVPVSDGMKALLEQVMKQVGAL
jgi:4-hydroxy-tetrahydrodipicolinate synthase